MFVNGAVPYGDLYRKVFTKFEKLIAELTL